MGVGYNVLYVLYVPRARNFERHFTMDVVHFIHDFGSILYRYSLETFQIWEAVENGLRNQKNPYFRSKK